MTKHEWKDQAGGEVRFYRAIHHGGNWELRAKAKGDEFWAPVESPTSEEIRQLRDVLWRKYQRQRCPYKLIEQVDQWIADLESTS